jgi:predicted nucleotidyltransferase
MTEPSSAESIIERVCDAVARVPSVLAVVLGGSRARGWHNDRSDIDIGLYYRGNLDLGALAAVARSLDDAHREDLASGFGDWGPWVNGGAWMTVAGTPVDLIYRDLDRVDRVIEEVHRGAFEIAYHYGHPLGYVSIFYAGELAVSQPLHDPQGLVAARKARLTPYPEALRRETIRRFLDEAEFTRAMAKKGAHAGDAAYVAGAGFRIVACLCHVLFALNREWLTNEKGAVARAACFPHRPQGFADRVETLFADLGGDPVALEASAVSLDQLVDDTRALAAAC